MYVHMYVCKYECMYICTVVYCCALWLFSELLMTVLMSKVTIHGCLVYFYWIKMPFWKHVEVKNVHVQLFAFLTACQNKAIIPLLRC